jgi:hypothetical protein
MSMNCAVHVLTVHLPVLTHARPLLNRGFMLQQMPSQLHGVVTWTLGCECTGIRQGSHVIIFHCLHCGLAITDSIRAVTVLAHLTCSCDSNSLVAEHSLCSHPALADSPWRAGSVVGGPKRFP